MRDLELKGVAEELKRFCHCAKEHDEIQVVLWENGEGFDISFVRARGDTTVSLTMGEVEALICLTRLL